MCIRDRYIIIIITHLLSPRLGVRCVTCTGNRKVVEEYEASRKESSTLPPPLYRYVRTRRSQKIHPRASRDRDGPSLWHLVNVGFIPCPGELQPYPLTKPTIHSYYAPFFLPQPVDSHHTH